jgi:hypothetical protein
MILRSWWSLLIRKILSTFKHFNAPSPLLNPVLPEINFENGAGFFLEKTNGLNPLFFKEISFYMKFDTLSSTSSQRPKRIKRFSKEYKCYHRRVNKWRIFHL